MITYVKCDPPWYKITSLPEIKKIIKINKIYKLFSKKLICAKYLKLLFFFTSVSTKGCF